VLPESLPGHGGSGSEAEGGQLVYFKISPATVFSVFAVLHVFF